MILHFLLSAYDPAFHATASTTWSNMFHLTVPWIEKILRPLLVYVFLVIGLRLAGKRELAQLNPFDLIVLLTLSNTVQNAIIGDDNTVLGGFIGAATLLLANSLLVRAVRNHKSLQRLIEGRPDVLVRDGKILRDHLNRELITREELLAAAHKQGIPSLAEVDQCILEPAGTVSFILKEPTTEGRRHDQTIELLQKLLGEVSALKAAKAGESGLGGMG